MDGGIFGELDLLTYLLTYLLRYVDGGIFGELDLLTYLLTYLLRYVDGGIFGELDFFLRNPRSFTAVASTSDTAVQVLTRDALQSMQSQAPQLAAALEHALLKYLSFQVNAKLGLSDGIADTSQGDR